MTVASLGHSMFAVGFIAFGVQQALFGDLVAGRPPAWPQAIPGQAIGVIVLSLCYIAAGMAILTGRERRRAALLVAVLVLVTAVVRNLPLAIADANFASPWTRLGKGIAFCGGALAIAGNPPLVHAGRIGFGLYLIASGLQHFLFTELVKTLVPAWIPGERLWAQFAGVALISGGLGFVVPRTTRLAGLAVGLMIFTWFVILHIPRALAASPAAQRNEWIAVVEALTFAGIAWLFTEAKNPQNR